MKKCTETSQGEILEERWKNFTESVQDMGEKFGGERIEEFKPLLYETFDYFYKEKDSEGVPHSDIKIIYYMSKFTALENWREGMRSEINMCSCQSFTDSLLWAIEHGFEEAYGFKKTMPHDFYTHGSNGWADMSTFETFEKELNSLIEMYEDDNEETLAEEEGWEEEE